MTLAAVIPDRTKSRARAKSQDRTILVVNSPACRADVRPDSAPDVVTSDNVGPDR